MQCAPFLGFDGDCRKAMSWYAELFGAPAPTIMTYGDAPPGGEVPGMDADKVMYADVRIGGAMLMGSDSPAGHHAAAQGMMVMVDPADAVDGRRIFDALAEGGEVTMPFEPTFWSSGFGMVRDRFGTPWIVSSQPQEA